MDDTSRRIRMTLKRLPVRLAAACIAIVTSRHLFANGFHYPMLLLLAHISLALVMELPNKKDDGKDTLAWRKWHLLYSASLAGALCLGYQSLLHVRNTMFWVMIISLNWDSMFWTELPWTINNLGFSPENVLRLSNFFLGIALLCLQEAKLADQRDLLLLGAVACSALARRCWVYGKDGTAGEQESAGNRIAIPALAVSIIPALAVFWTHEWTNTGDFRVTGWIVCLFFVSMFAGAIPLHGNLFEAAERSKSQSRVNRDPGLRWLVCSILLVIVVELDNDLLQPRSTNTSFGQWLAFLVASLATLDGSVILDGYDESIQDLEAPVHTDAAPEDDVAWPLLESEVEDSRPGDSSGILRKSVALQVHVIPIGILWLLLFFWLYRLTIRTLPVWSSSGTTASDLDIVIARYEEPLQKVAEDMESIMSVPAVAGLRTRIFLYNKSSFSLNGTGSVPTFPSADEVIVEDRPNVGREAETYLSHILGRPDDLAMHTLFIQAEPHELSSLKARIAQYFVEDTGFLSLSYPNNFCSDCSHCGDLGGWLGDGAVIQDMFEKSNAGQQCRDLSLTYRGQFIVSADRIREIGSAAFWDARVRVLEDAEFGYHMERMWGIIFGCPRISPACPSLFSGLLGNCAAVGDCQCLDTKET